MAALVAAPSIACAGRSGTLWRSRSGSASRPAADAGPAAAERLGSRGQVTHVRVPRLLLHRPAQLNGMAVIVVASGGYHSIERGQHSEPAALWLAALGVTGFELVYRLPDDAWPVDTTVADGLRAVRARPVPGCRLWHRSPTHRHDGFLGRRASRRPDDRRCLDRRLSAARRGGPDVGPARLRGAHLSGADDDAALEPDPGIQASTR